MAMRIVRRSVNPVSSDALSLRDMMIQLMENAFVSPDQYLSDWLPGNGCVTVMLTTAEVVLNSPLSVATAVRA